MVVGFTTGGEVMESTNVKVQGRVFVVFIDRDNTAEAVLRDPFVFGTCLFWGSRTWELRVVRDLACHYRKLHAHSDKYVHKLFTTRRVVDTINTSHNQVLEPGVSSNPPDPLSIES
eukprot:349482-Pelagomonas_calceolata.AAC.2